MNAGLALVIGVGVGVVVGLLIGPASESKCCKRVNAGVRDEFRDQFGATATSVGDAVGLFGRSAAVLDWLGVPSDFTG